MEEMHAWVARDKDGMLYLYLAKPRKNQSKWLPNIRFEFIELSRESFPEVQWTDDEPTKVKLIIEKWYENLRINQEKNMIFRSGRDGLGNAPQWRSDNA